MEHDLKLIKLKGEESDPREETNNLWCGWIASKRVKRKETFEIYKSTATRDAGNPSLLNGPHYSTEGAECL
jgi:hypothetical protein